MKKATLFLIASLYAGTLLFAQGEGVTFKSTDTTLQYAFERARQMALHYKGGPDDAVGPWYESALPPRYAFCMRDVSHQSIGGEILGLHAANVNMFTLFAKNISERKDWCSYWEINREGKPAPEDYRNDTAFWYNLNANFDLLTACWNLYLWTGDKRYINDPVFANFHAKTVDEYIERWVLQPDSLFSRPAYPNAPQPFNEEDAFHRCRGLPSYSEGVPGIKMGIDLVAAIYRGLLSYSYILAENGQHQKAAIYKKRAGAYQQHIDRYWWDDRENKYYTYYSNKGAFGKQEGETFVLWFDALIDPVRKRKTIEHLLANDWNIENLSYFPVIMYNNGYWEKGRHYLLYLANAATPRREYPEVSFGAIEGFVQGLMGIRPNARTGLISTLYQSADSSGALVTLSNLPVLQTAINITHKNRRSSLIDNKGDKVFKWQPEFIGKFRFITVNGRKMPAQQQQRKDGRVISFVQTTVAPGQSISAQAD